MDSPESDYKGYLQIVAKLIKEYALEAKNGKLPNEILNNRDYFDGYIMGFHRVISLLIQEAETFGVDLSEIGFTDFDPDNDL